MSRRRFPRLFGCLVVLAMVLGASATDLAAQGTTTGAIRGRIVDASGAPVPSVAVIGVNQETGFQRVVESAENGFYTLRLLPPGIYAVSVRRIGFEPVELRDVRVIVGNTTPLDVAVREAVIALTPVTVTASGQIDVTSASVKTTVGLEQIQNLPALGRDFTDFINLSGTVSPHPEMTTGGQFAIAGMRPSQTNVQIDGVDANNSFFGENRGGSRIPFAFSLESIREFQVITNGYDVEYGNYAGGVVNIVTRGGSNEFKGTVYGNFRNDALTADNFDGTDPRNYSVQQYAAQVEGPIIRDRLHFLVSLDGQRRREPFRPISPAIFRADDEPALADSLERFFQILESVYGVNDAAAGFDEFEMTNDVLTLFGRLDWSINDAHRLSLRNNYSTYENLNEAGSFALDAGLSQAEQLRDDANSFVAELSSVLRPTVLNILRVQYATEKRPRVGNVLTPTLSVSTAGQTFEYGGNFISFDNNLDESKFQIIDNLTMVAGNHEFTFGTNNTFSQFENRFWLNGSGTYQFNSLADLEAMRPATYARNVAADGRPPTAEFSVQEYAVYAQDEWRLTPQLLATLGLRYDVARYGDRPGRVIDVERAFGFETGVAPIDDDNVSPRLQLTYDVTGDGSQVVRAGVGLFYGRTPYVLGSNVAITDVPLLSLDCRGEIGEPDAPPPLTQFPTWSPGGADNPMNCAGAAGIGGIPTYSFWHQGFEIPETVKASLGYERVLWERTRGSIDLLFSETSKLYTVRNLNLREPQFTLASEGGRRVFVPESSFDAVNAAGAARLRNTDFGDLFVNYNDGVARSFSGTFTVEHRVNERTQFTGTYTYTRAYDNSSFSCCTSFEGFTGQDYGIYGPNVIGEIGDEAGGWGPSDWVRDHVLVFSGIFELPWDIRATTIWRMQSGTPWTPEVSGDINGDGVRFNDRPFVFAPADLPVFVPAGTPAPERDAIIGANRALYASHLREYACVGDFVGEIVPRNSCRNPWFNRLDLSLRKRIPTVNGQAAELSIDLFNVLNGINDDWGVYESVSSFRRNLINPQGYNPDTGEIEYLVPATFGNTTALGSNLLLQFQAQIGLRYSF